VGLGLLLLLVRLLRRAALAITFVAWCLSQQQRRICME